MTDRQANFWRELTAPFIDDAYKSRSGGKAGDFEYISPRCIQNRLDDVCGPDGWKTQYTVTGNATVCDLEVRAPDGNNSYTWISRSGVGSSFELEDPDFNAKATATAAFKIAASCYGIGRDLYSEGMPQYCADIHGVGATGVPSATPHKRSTEPRQRSEGSNGGGGRDFGFEPPIGKQRGIYPWSCKCRDHFNVDVISKMNAYAKAKGQPFKTNEWTQEFADDCCRAAVEWLKTQPNYAGEFDGAQAQQPSQPPVAAVATSLFGAPAFPGAAAAAVAAGQVRPPWAQQVAALQTPSDNNEGSKLAIVAALKAVTQNNYGRPATDGEIIQSIGYLSASVANGKGHRGEILESLRDCTDGVWVANMLKEANVIMAEAAARATSHGEAAKTTKSEIPF